MTTAARPKPKRTYRFRDDETVPDAIRRIALGRIDHALEELRGKTDSTAEEAVHEARKDMKRLRALIRLAGPELGDDAYARENATFRDAGRLLSGVRDADVMVGTLDGLLAGDGHAIPAEAGAGLHQALAKTGDESGERSLASAQAVELLEGAWDRVHDWPLELDGFEALEDGLRRTYRRGRNAYRSARDEPSAEQLHEWRKRSKDLWYHHQLLQASWPEAMAPLADQAHELSDYLGDDHDLAVLEAWAKAHAAEAGGLAALQELIDAIEERRKELQADAFRLGERLYAERPGAFVRRLRGYWRGWREAPTSASS
jgi:CHAD domain-containing protein